MSRIDEKRKRTLLGIIAVLLSVCFFFLAFRVFTLLDAYFGWVDNSGDDLYAHKSTGRPECLVDGKWYVQKGNVETFLLIGIDKFEAETNNEDTYRNHEQSDAVFLLAVDRKNESYSLIHINRDTMVNIRMFDIMGNPYDTFSGQLALSHTYGSGREDSCENTVWSVSDYLYGLQIDHYAAVSMDAVAVMNDAIGGVTLTVSDDMSVVDEALKQGATVTLRGEQALTYIRSRQQLSDSTNLNRMARQRQYVTGFIGQARTAISENDGLAADIVLSVSDYLVSDIAADELLSMADDLHNFTFTGITDIEGEARNGEQYMEFRADETALQKLVLETFFVKK